MTQEHHAVSAMLNDYGYDMLAILVRYGHNFAIVAPKGSDRLRSIRLPKALSKVNPLELCKAALNAS